MAYLLLSQLLMRAIRQLQLTDVVLRNMPRQAVTSVAIALAAASAPGCAPSSTVAGADAEPPADARAQPTPDAAGAADAAPTDRDAAPASDAGPLVDGAPSADASTAPYRHTIVIDGTNDFSETNDAFGTTSASYAAYVSWDDTHVYIGYMGEDIGSSDGNRWVMIFFDSDPGDATGATVGEQYNTQQPGFPAGFGAEYYFRWKASNDFQDLQGYASEAWSDTGVTPTTFQSGTFLETAIPRAALGDPATLGVISLMLNETDLAEAAYAGLYAGSFTDGYFDVDTAPIPIAAYLHVDFADHRAPNATANRRP